MATYTKGVAGLICTPFLVIAAIFHRSVLSVLKSKEFYIGLIVLIGLVGFHYIYRDFITPGYWNAVVFEELGGRFSGEIPGHDHPWYYYLKLMFFTHYTFWFPFLILGIILRVYDIKNRQYLNYCLAAGLYYLLIVSSIGTKLEWYAMPVYPFFSAIVGSMIFFIYSQCKRVHIYKNGYNYLGGAFLLLLLVFGIFKVKENFFTPHVRPFEEETFNINYFLKDQYENLDDPDKYILINEGYYAHLLFYKYYHHENGRDLRITTKENINPGDIIILHEFSVLEYVSNKFEARELGRYENVKTVKIIDYK
ncbi:hypothetical protein GCM10007940_03220 [Portibacter lacus]|uniref:Glycosyltransferase RgtA/B/C/D-like domain-containing protein n=1 Tax=Portibacter lacus TaxID=1099794 RepID=A0AA37SKU3_9BACT|nr:hypothetical protein GCM10007940_03220 [Portibacter lacus]